MGQRVVRWRPRCTWGGTDVRTGMVTVGIPVQSPAGEIENPVEGLPWSRVGIEHQNARETRRRIGRADNQVSVPSQDAYVVGVLVVGMLPAALADGANQHQLARMNMRITVVGLVRILGRVVGIH